MNDLLDGIANEGGRIEGDGPSNVGRERRRGTGHFLAHRCHRIQGVGARLQVHENQRGGTTVESADQVIALRTQFDPGDILQADQRSLWGGTQDDLLVIGDFRQPATGQHRYGHLHFATGRSLPHCARGEHGVLVAQCGCHIGHGHSLEGQTIWVDPDPHRVVFAAKHRGIAHARNALDAVEEVDRGVVAQEQVVVGAVLGLEQPPGRGCCSRP